MRITKQQLAQLIKEELGILLNEQICTGGQVWDHSLKMCVTPRVLDRPEHLSEPPVHCDPNNPTKPCDPDQPVLDLTPTPYGPNKPTHEEHPECPPGQLVNLISRTCEVPLKPKKPRPEDTWALQESPKKQQVREAVQKAIRETLKSKK